MQYTWLFFSYFSEVLTKLSPVTLTLVALITINGLVIGRVERWTPGEALYHAFINATTVGYGDFRPSQPASRLLCVINAFLGLLCTGILVGAGVYAVEKTFELML